MPYLIEAAVAVLAVVLQVILSNTLSVLGAVPDLALVYLMWVVIRRGQLPAELIGFGLGLLVDILSSGALGSHSLTYTIVGFLLGYFSDADQIEQRLRNWPFLLFVAAGTLLNGLIYYLLFKLTAGVSLEDYFTGQIGLATVYTTIVAIGPMFYASRRPLY
ncbi:MAG: rod shape-determining protein MreD [Bacteroidetes bacterium]|nr:rod shape-determining protein MreD [Bacteroidota bacterium]